MPSSQSATGTQSDATSAAIPLERLSQQRGHWAAFSPDGARLIASAATLAKLEIKLRELGENLEEVLFERVPDGDHVASGAELT